MARLLRRELSQRDPGEMADLLLLCASQLSTKTPHYAALVALLEQEQPELVAQLLSRGELALAEALGAGERMRARLLLRFFACLAAAGVVEPESLVGALRALVDAALEIAAAGGLLRRGWRRCCGGAGGAAAEGLAALLQRGRRRCAGTADVPG